MILLIDNYDSFTYDLVQRLGEIDPGLPMDVRRNDRVTADEVAALKPTPPVPFGDRWRCDSGAPTYRKRRPTRPSRNR